MKYLQTALPPGESDAQQVPRIRLIVDVWNELRVCEELGETTWETLEPLERQVTEALHHDPPDITSADRLTAQALALIAGCTNL